MRRSEADSSAGGDLAQLLGRDPDELDSSWEAMIVCYKVSRPDLANCVTFIVEEGSPARERLGLGDEAAMVILRRQGDEFARLEGPQATRENLDELLGLYEAEPQILSEASSGPGGASCSLVKLMLAQRRLSAAVVAWKGIQADGDQPTLCLLARRIADLALELSRYDEAIPLFEHILAHTNEEVHRVEAWSRLIRCHLILGNTEEAERLSGDGNRPSKSFKLG